MLGRPESLDRHTGIRAQYRFMESKGRLQLGEFGKRERLTGMAVECVAIALVAVVISLLAENILEPYTEWRRSQRGASVHQLASAAPPPVDQRMPIRTCLSGVAAERELEGRRGLKEAWGGAEEGDSGVALILLNK